ncbi:hypothetical protein ACJRW5_15045 [Pseudomonas sp. SH1-B]
MSLPAPSPLVFCSNPIEGDLPFKAWTDLSLEIDGQPEHDEKLLNLAGFLVRQALVDQHPQRIEHARDVEALLYGLKAHVQLHSGGCFDFADEHTSIELQAHEATPGMAIGNLLLLADEHGCEGIELLHERLKPENALANALIKLQQTDMEPTHLICALLPAMSITLTPSFADSYTLEYPSRLETYQQELKQNELAGLAQERCEIFLGDQKLDETQPAYPVAYSVLSVMLRLLRQRSLENRQADLASRQEEWQRIRLRIGSERRYEAQFMLDPQTYQPAFGKAVRGLKLAGTQSVLLPEHLDLPALEQIWETLAPKEMLAEWQRVQRSKDSTDRSLMINLEVGCTLEVLASAIDQPLHVLESYRDAEFIAQTGQEKAEQVANASPTDDATSPSDHSEAEKRPGRYGPVLLAGVCLALMIAILLKA